MSDDSSMSHGAASPYAAAETMAFAMIGAVAELQRCLPRLVASQRSKWDQQVNLARFIGQMAVGQARQQIRQRVTPSPAPGASRPSSTAPVVVADTVPTVVEEATAHGAASALPIEHYDELTASQVMDRLASLDLAELEAVNAYESTHRRRRTVLGRIEQRRAALEPAE